MPTRSGPSPLSLAACCGLPQPATTRAAAVMAAARRDVADPLIGRLSLHRRFAFAHARSASTHGTTCAAATGRRTDMAARHIAGGLLHSGPSQCGPPVHGVGAAPAI